MLKNKTAIVTGGTKGIGKGIVLTFLKNNANVVVTYKSDETSATLLKDELVKLNISESRYLILKSDISNMSETEEIVERTISKFGNIDILVNNAGVVKDMLMLKMSSEDFGGVVETNLNGTFNMTKAALKVILKNRAGSIINMSSINGIEGAPGQVNYSASKAGIIGFTKSIAKEIGIRNVRVNAIAPGFIETDMTKELKEEYKNKILENIPLGRAGMPTDVANVALFLASDMSSYVTGEVIRVDGGL